MKAPRKTEENVQYSVYNLLKTGYKGTCTQISTKVKKHKGSVSSGLVQMRKRGLIKVEPGTSPHVYSINAGVRTEHPKQESVVHNNPKKVNTTVLVEGSAEVEVTEKEILIKISR